MKLWEYKKALIQYRDIAKDCEEVMDDGKTNVRSFLAFVSNEMNGSAKYGDPDYRNHYDYKDRLYNVFHFTIMGLLSINHNELRKYADLNIEKFIYDEDSFLFEEYIVKCFNQKTVEDTLEKIVPEDRDLFKADVDKVVKEIGFELQ